MKFAVFAAIALALTSSVDVPFAEARSLKRYDQAELTRLRLDPQLGIEEATGGSLEVDYLEHTAKLVLAHNLCPQGARCIMGPTIDLEITLPIVSMGTDSCGSFVITAERDERPVDGKLARLVISNHSTRHCEDSLPGLVTATLTTSGYYRSGHATNGTASSFVSAQGFGRTILRMQ